MIQDTSKTELLWLLLEAQRLGPSGAITAMEKRGQDELARDSALPTDGLSTLPAEWGITVGTVRDGDPMFTEVTLPQGWQVKPTDHDMWSDLVDDAGTVRARIFYKAAFYDRCAFIRVAQ